MPAYTMRRRLYIFMLGIELCSIAWSSPMPGLQPWLDRFKRVDVDHPTGKMRLELAANGCASLLGGDRAV